MPLLFDYLKIPDCFKGWNISFAKNQLNYNNDLSQIKNKNYALQKLIETDFLTVIGNAKLRFCTLTYSFYVKLFAIIILS